MAQRNHRQKNQPQTQPRTLVAIVRDKSYSMSDRVSATISGTQDYIETLRREAEGEVLITMVEFNDMINDMFVMKPLDNITRYDLNRYRPDGRTALMDAVGHTIKTIEEHERDDDRVLFVILTDGLENASRRYSRSHIQTLIQEREADGWEFLYLGAGRSAWHGGELLGLRYDQTVYYSDDPRDHSSGIAVAARANVATTKSARGAGASYMFLASSPEKSNLETAAGSRPQQEHSVPGDTYSRVTPPPAKASRRGGNASSILSQRARQQKRDSNGRFIRSR